MKKAEINRDMLKKNIMKRIVIRFDYQGIIDMENFQNKVKNFFSEYFNSFERKYINSIDLNLPDPEEISQTLNIPIDKIIKEEIYSYTQNKKWNDEVILNFNKFSAEMKIFCKNYDKIDDYLHFFYLLLENFKENIDFFYIKKLSLRKYSWEFFENYQDIFDVFNTEVFPKKIKENNIVDSDLLEIYKIKDFFINYKRIINTGIAFDEELNEEKEIYKASLDFEAYKNNVQNIDDDILEVMNLELFEFYKNSVTENFLNNNLA